MSRTIITIIISFNGSKWIEKCLQSLRNSAVETDVLIIDNGSTDQTVELIQQHFSEVTLVQSKENLGFGAANNMGIQMALDNQYEYFFLLNQDTWVEDETIGVLHDSIINNPEFGIISPVHLNGQSSALDRNFEWYMREEIVPGLLENLHEGTLDKVLHEVPFVNAAAWMISRSCVINVGKFHPMFYHYGEDDNYVHRVLAAGYKVGVQPIVTICHDREYRDESLHPDDFEKLLYKDLALYLLNPAVGWTFRDYKRHVKKRVKLYRDRTGSARNRANIDGLRLAMMVYFKSRKYYDLKFEIK